MRFVAGALIALAVAVPAAADTWRHYKVASVQRTLHRYNALRASYGAQPVTFVRSWAEGCARHMAYLKRNDSITHTEQRGRPGYSKLGAQEGGRSVISFPYKREPFPAGKPLGNWKTAPFHQALVLNPLIARTGFSKGCLDTIGGLQNEFASRSSDPPRLLAWPGDGATHVPRAIDACVELPSDPFSKFGWKCNKSGTAFYVYELDPQAQTCAQPEVKPQVTVTAGGRTLQTGVTDGGDCAWIVATHGVLPKHAQVTLSVTAAGATLSHTFST
ncbi:MAG: hypothetical protein QOF76_521 [Solirubrobacteraceae bacterium]|nr:hypothetical protein [Solirubrobacteraceae bacterium]